MTDTELKQYRNILKEINDQEKRIETLCRREVPVISGGMVKASMRQFPYTEIRVGVQMKDPAVVSEMDKLIDQKRKRVEECWKQIRRIEKFIREIQDSELRQIFEYRYIDGMKLREIGDRMNMDRSSIGKKICTFLNFPPHSPK